MHSSAERKGREPFSPRSRFAVFSVFQHFDRFAFGFDNGRPSFPGKGSVPRGAWRRDRILRHAEF